jgi:type I restriction enzyme S subunit
MNDGMNHDLPQGWTVATLRDVIEHCQPGFASGKKDVADGVPHLRMNNVGVRGEMVTDLIRRVPKALAKPRYELRSGDVLVCTTNSSKLVGKCTYFDLAGRYVFSNHLTRLRPLDVVDGRFLRWNLWLHWRRGEFEDKCKHWVNQSSLPKESLLETEVALPPVAEQRRILLSLEAILGRVVASRERLEKLDAILTRLRESVFTAACSGRLTADWREQQPRGGNVDAVLQAIRRRREAHATTPSQQERVRSVYAVLEQNDSTDLPPGWRYVALSKLCSSFDYGTAAKSRPTGEVPVLRMGNIQNGEIDWMDLVYASNREEIEHYSLQPNTVLFNRTNSPELVGKTAIYRGERPAIFAGYLIRINPVAELDPEYLNCCLNTAYARDFCAGVKTDGVSQSNINAQRLGTFEVPFCSLAEQKEIVGRVKGLLALADRTSGMSARVQAHVDRLIPSLLTKAFRGELVATEADLARRRGEDYEPASALLERIRREQGLEPGPLVADPTDAAAGVKVAMHGRHRKPVSTDRGRRGRLGQVRRRLRTSGDHKERNE